jgi:hypothetical protein
MSYISEEMSYIFGYYVLHMNRDLSYTLRMPSNLKYLLDTEAKRRGVSTASLVVEACWSLLEKPTTPRQTVALPVAPAVKMNEAMAQFLTRVPAASPEPPEEHPPCLYTEWSEELGETLHCSLAEHSPKRKHLCR